MPPFPCPCLCTVQYRFNHVMLMFMFIFSEHDHEHGHGHGHSRTSTWTQAWAWTWAWTRVWTLKRAWTLTQTWTRTWTRTPGVDMDATPLLIKRHCFKETFSWVDAFACMWISAWCTDGKAYNISSVEYHYQKHGHLEKHRNVSRVDFLSFLLLPAGWTPRLRRMSNCQAGWAQNYALSGWTHWTFQEYRQLRNFRLCKILNNDDLKFLFLSGRFGLYCREK